MYFQWKHLSTKRFYRGSIYQPIFTMVEFITKMYLPWQHLFISIYRVNIYQPVFIVVAFTRKYIHGDRSHEQQTFLAASSFKYNIDIGVTEYIRIFNR
jgi:hypothetical protein